MLTHLFRMRRVDAAELIASQLFDQRTFYPAFVADLGRCRSEVIIESPFITLRRTARLLPTLRKLRERGVAIIINTRDPQEHSDYLFSEAQEAIAILQDMGAQVLFTGGHHRKLAILDHQILWEGSLNILSQSDSCEIMRRSESKQLVKQMERFIDVKQMLAR